MKKIIAVKRLNYGQAKQTLGKGPIEAQIIKESEGWLCLPCKTRNLNYLKMDSKNTRRFNNAFEQKGSDSTFNSLKIGVSNIRKTPIPHSLKYIDIPLKGQDANKSRVISVSVQGEADIQILLTKTKNGVAAKVCLATRELKFLVNLPMQPSSRLTFQLDILKAALNAFMKQNKLSKKDLSLICDETNSYIKSKGSNLYLPIRSLNDFDILIQNNGKKLRELHKLATLIDGGLQDIYSSANYFLICIEISREINRYGNFNIIKASTDQRICSIDLSRLEKNILSMTINKIKRKKTF